MASVRFTFIGKLEANTDVASKGYYLREGKTKNGNEYLSINFQIVQEKNNRSFCEAFGQKSNKIETLDKDNKKISIDWADRFDEDVEKDVADFKKTTIGIGDERKKFISSYDAIKYLVDNINEIKGKKVVVVGQRKKNIYNGKVSDRFEFSSIRTIDDEDTVNKLTVNMDLYYNKDSFDFADWKDEHKIIINGWTKEYVAETKENRFLDQQVVLDCSKLDLENEKHINQLTFRLKMLGCDYEDGKIVVKLKTKKLMKMGIVTSFVNGQEQIDFDESMLTDLQKEALELGLKTLDDFKPSGNIYGQRIVIYKLRDFNMRDDSPYKDGAIDSELTQDDFDEKYYVPAEKINVEDVLEESDDSNEDDEDDLFG